MKVHSQPLPPESSPVSEWEQLATPDGNRWVITELNASGEAIGTAYRLQNDKKSFNKGGKCGLIKMNPLQPHACYFAFEHIFVCNGAADTAPLIGLGLDAVGIPMASKGGEMLSELLEGRHAVIVRGIDEAGLRSEEQFSRSTVLNCVSVKITNPPGEAEDTREAVIRGAQKHDVLESATGADVFPIPTPGLESKRNKFQWHSINKNGPTVEPDWLWLGFLVLGGICLQRSLWKAGMSPLLALLLRDFFRCDGLVSTPIEGPVILVPKEPIALWASRRDKLGLDVKCIKIIQPSSPTRCTDILWRQQVTELEISVSGTNTELVVFDTLSGFWSVANENDASELLDALALSRDLAKAGAALCAMHHPRKTRSLRFSLARGSGVLSVFPDILLKFGRINSDPQSTQQTLQAVALVRHELNAIDARRDAGVRHDQ